MPFSNLQHFERFLESLEGFRKAATLNKMILRHPFCLPVAVCSEPVGQQSRIVIVPFTLRVCVVFVFICVCMYCFCMFLYLSARVCLLFHLMCQSANNEEEDCGCIVPNPPQATTRSAHHCFTWKRKSGTKRKYCSQRKCPTLATTTSAHHYFTWKRKIKRKYWSLVRGTYL